MSLFLEKQYLMQTNNLYEYAPSGFDICAILIDHAEHTRKASRISKTAVENCGKGVGNFYLS